MFFITPFLMYSSTSYPTVLYFYLARTSSFMSHCFSIDTFRMPTVNTGSSITHSDLCRWCVCLQDARCFSHQQCQNPSAAARAPSAMPAELLEYLLPAAVGEMLPLVLKFVLTSTQPLALPRMLRAVPNFRLETGH